MTMTLCGSSLAMRTTGSSSLLGRRKALATLSGLSFAMRSTLPRYFSTNSNSNDRSGGAREGEAMSRNESSPARPPSHLFKEYRGAATEDGEDGEGGGGGGVGRPVVVLHTDYVDARGSSASYAVVDEKAFEAILDTALRGEPLTNVEFNVSSPSSSSSSSIISAAASSPSAASAASTTTTNAYANTYTTRELVRALHEIQEELKPLLVIKDPIDYSVKHRYYVALKYGCLALLAAQFVVYFNWVFFVFDWNLVEPTTYFLGYTAVFGSLVYHYYRCGNEDFTWKNMFSYAASKRALKRYEEKGLDIARVEDLQEKLRWIEEELKRYKL